MLTRELSSKQLTVISALSSGATMTDAAEEVCITRNTIHHWLRNWPPFQQTLNQVSPPPPKRGHRAKRPRRQVYRPGFLQLQRRLHPQMAPCIDPVVVLPVEGIELAMAA